MKKSIRASLQSKLILSYLAVALLTVLVVTVFIRLTSGERFYELVVEQQAGLLRDEAVYYYEQTGTWEGFAEYYQDSLRPEREPPPEGQPPTEGDRFSGSGPVPGGLPREIRGLHGLVDTSFRALFPYKGFALGDTVPSEFLNARIPVEVEGETVAWIIPDEGIRNQLSTEEEAFLTRTNRAILLAAAAGILGAVLMGILLARNFLKPVRNLILASRQMAGGDLEQQVPVESQDELGQLSRTFNQMSADLARSDRQRRQLTADITHDLSTPLQVIAGYMEMLEDEEVQLTSERIRIIMNEIEQLRRLVGDLSLLTTADAKELNMDLEVIEPEAILAQIRNAYQGIARKEGKIVEIQVMPATPPVFADPGRMVQVISNLVDNALRYTPVGGEIRLTARGVEGKVEIRVKDSGTGIHPDDLPYVFDRFYRADKSRSGNNGKLGLGLAIAKALVVAQGGSITVESIPEEPGTTFVLTFPAYAP